MPQHIKLGKWSESDIDELLKKTANIKDLRERIQCISENFLSTRYQESTLTGSNDSEEKFVVNLEGMDCLTFIEYVESMRRARNFDEFKRNLHMLRYRNGVVSFGMRNHFFSDWKSFNSDNIVDVTETIGGEMAVSITKKLNEGEDGILILEGVQARVTDLTYIPAERFNDSMIESLITGDYVGIYSERPGLDVSHVGIIIKKDGRPFLRHASSSKKFRKVIDQDFAEYIKSRPGFIVFRPKD